MIIFQSTWPQFDISSCSYQSYSVIALILLYLAAPFFTATGCFCLAFIYTKATSTKSYVSQARPTHLISWNNVYENF